MYTFEDLDFLFWLFHFSENESKLKGPPNPNDDKLIVAALAAKGLNWDLGGSDCTFFSE